MATGRQETVLQHFGDTIERVGNNCKDQMRM